MNKPELSHWSIRVAPASHDTIANVESSLTRSAYHGLASEKLLWRFVLGFADSLTSEILL